MLLSYDDVAKCLAAAGVPAVRERLAADAASAAEFGIPVVLKLVSPALVHKADVGAVELDVRGHDAAVAVAGRLVELAGKLALGDGEWQILSVGNQASLTVGDYLDYFAADEATTAIALILEGVRDGQDLLASIDRVTRAGKPVLVLKSGRSGVGARAVQSHTGSIAGDYTVYRALLGHGGAVVVESMTELLDALAVHDIAAGISPGARFAVVSTSDPVDVTGRVTADPGIFGQTLDVLLGSAEIDAVAISISTVADPMAEHIAGQIVEAVAGSGKPVVVSWTIAAELARRGLAVLREAGIPVFGDPARAVQAVSLVNGTGFRR